MTDRTDNAFKAFYDALNYEMTRSNPTKDRMETLKSMTEACKWACRREKEEKGQ